MEGNPRPTESSSEVKFEIGHVLFIDIVGYSKLLITEQSEQIQKLKEIVRGTEQFRLAQAEGKLLRLPTGDGGALVFRNSPEAPVLCALEISKALRTHPELRVRMGIHSGPVNEVTDLNEQANIAGAGINVAQRVMDCGDAGHILLSKHLAEDLEQYPQWRSHLRDLGECEVKHGVRVHAVNFYTDDVGNRAVPAKFKAVGPAAPPAAKPAIPKWALIGGTILILIAVALGSFLFWQRGKPKTSGTTSVIPEKSIAVLPFGNLSRDPDNAYFAEGVQDEILTRLAKVADLKVISHTSTQRFKSAPEDLRQIAKQLGVANVLEGSVQKAADQVRVNVQLINALTDAHLWADTYDRKLTDIFAVESEIAKTIADTLQVKLTGSEKTAIAKRPTANSEAYELYLKGRFFWNKRTGNDIKKSIDYFNQAIAKDPGYALAYAGLADGYALLSDYAVAPPRDAFPKAKVAAQKALELDSTLAEAHTSLAEALASYNFDFTQAIAEFKRAIELNSNYATAHHWYGNSVLMPLGRFDEAIAECKRAVELDPFSVINNADLGQTYYMAHRYDEAIDQLRKTVEIEPGAYYAHYDLGEAFEAKSDLAAAIAEYKTARELNDDPFSLGLLGNAYAVSGKTAEALKVLDQLEQISKQRYVAAYSFALVHLGLGHKDEALRWLEKSYEDRAAYDVLSIPHDPLLDPLRGDPRFEALVEKIVPLGAK
jgi:TolB-like protein/Flp pilus assembly protein TadD